MVTTVKTLKNLKAIDLMSSDLVLIPQEMSLQGAAHMLARAQVSGAPVVDEWGRCVGVLSTTDFMRWAETGPPGKEELLPEPEFCSDWQVLDLETLPKESVRQFMTSDPVTVSPTVPIQELSRIMLDAHIHRVVVVDSQHRPIGVISSTDVLAAVAHGGHAS
jgi:CBS-domain-containing membrane protein